MLVPSIPRPASAVVIGASGGIGGAFVAALATSGLALHAFARRPLAPRDGIVTGHIDLLDENSIALAAASLTAGPPPRLVIVATGLLHDGDVVPEKTMRALDPARLARVFAINTIGPALVAKHVIPLLPRAERCVFAVLSARVGSIQDNRLGGWYGYRAAKAALNQMIRTLAIETRRTRPDAILVALHPGTVATDLSAPFQGNVVADSLFTPDQSAAHLLRVIEGLTLEDSGGLLAWDGRHIPF